MMAGSVYGFVKFAERAETEAATADAIMPSRLIASGETIDASMLRTVRVAKAAIPADAVRDAEAVIGSTAVVPIGPNETIASWKLADRQLTPREGERYVSFPTDDVTNVSNMLRRGDRVDVWVEFDEPVLLNGRLRGAVKVAENVLVASVRTQDGTEVTDSRAYDAPFQSSGKQMERVRSEASGKAGMNTFIMSEEVYDAFALASIAGKVKLVLPEPTEAAADAGAGDAPTVTGEFTALRELLASKKEEEDRP